MTEQATYPAVSDRARQILVEATRHDGTPPVSDQALLAAEQSRRSVLECDDAFGIVGEGELDLVVRPSARGRGIGRRMLDRLLEAQDQRRAGVAAAPVGRETRAATGAGGTGDGGTGGSGSAQTTGELRAWAHGENPAAEHLLRTRGFAPVRELLRLSLDPALLPAGIAGARALPAGFSVVAFDPSNAKHANDWVRVNAAAFAHHPEQGKMTRTDLDALLCEPWFVSEDLRLAYTGQARETPATPPNDGGRSTARVQGTAADAADSTDSADSPDSPRLAGFTWVKTVREGARVETELYALGVDPAFAGVGLGAALLGETLRRMKQHDPDRVTLYVDGDNTAALALYVRAGFTVEQRSVQYVRGC